MTRLGRRRHATWLVACCLVLVGGRPADARLVPDGGAATAGARGEATRTEAARVAGPDRAGGVPRYRWPVAGLPVATFDPPASPWGPGHRGIDLQVDVGERVAAMAGGTVGFAGVVAGRAWVSVDHPDGVRTTVGPLAVVAVRAGDVVAVGQVLGTAAGTAHADGSTPVTGRLHVSARVAGTYVDPAGLVGTWVATLVAPP